MVVPSSNLSPPLGSPTRIGHRSYYYYYVMVFVFAAGLIALYSQSRAISLFSSSSSLRQLSVNPKGSSFALFQKTSGKGWSLWHDSDTPLYNDDWSMTCIWASFRAYKSPEHNHGQQHSPVSMCTYGGDTDKYISKQIENAGRWAECDLLSDLLAEPVDQWYIDIGANIGSCVMQVLMTTNASIAAFEPDPRNLFRLTSTISQLAPELRKRVYVFPIALGKEQGFSQMFAVQDNRGNSAVGRGIKDFAHQSFLQPLPIQIERMDDLIQVDSTIKRHVVVKMDAQGYECNIVQGMPRFLDMADIVFFELERIMLRAFPNCSEQVLWDAFNNGWLRFLPHQQMRPIDTMPEVGAVNVLAKRARLPRK